ncbi:DinB/UmuC family translesion DNA polymerase [Streptomyces melanogenes]|uniref:DNA polymerase Y family protein n=1 Tax=Streptomyces melanogenes TaxID=67326 RepID=UPI0037B2CAF0
MTTASSRQRCVMRVRFHLDHADGSLFDRLLTLVAQFTPRYQPCPPDTVDLDLTGALPYFGQDPHGIGQLLRLRALALYGVHTTVGAGPSPMIAAMAAAETPPGHITVIPPSTVTAFLNPRPVAALPGAGKATAKTLADFGITTIGQLATTRPATLARLLGTAAARELQARAQGHDPRPVTRTALTRSTARAHRFPYDELDPHEHRRALTGLAEAIGFRLREQGEACRSVSITVRYADASTTTRSRTLPEPTAHTGDLTRTAHQLYEALGLQRARVRELSLRAQGLCPAEQAHHQLQLGTADDKTRRIEKVADAARARFGAHIIRPATLAAPPS